MSIACWEAGDPCCERANVRGMLAHTNYVKDNACGHGETRLCVRNKEAILAQVVASPSVPYANDDGREIVDDGRFLLVVCCLV